MIFIGILLSMTTIAFLCWLLFTLAVFALPLFVGITAGTWTYGTGAGWLGAILVGFAAAALTFGLGSFLLSAIRTTWARLLIAAAFVVPAAAADFHATHGIVKHTMSFPAVADGVFDPRSRRRWHCRLRAHHRKEDVRPPMTGTAPLPDTAISVRRTRQRTA